MQWSGDRNAGFSEAEPWFYVNPNYRTVNAEAEEADPDSILHFYKKCLHLRKEEEVFIRGDYREYYPASRRIYMYARRYRGERVLVICSFCDKILKPAFPRGYDADEAELLLTSERMGGSAARLLPFEAQVWRWTSRVTPTEAHLSARGSSR